VYAVIEMGGKQHRVTEGDHLRVELLPDAVGSTIETDKVLLIGGEKIMVGAPYVPNAKVSMEIVEHGRLPKVIIHKHIRRKNYHRTRGHRQDFSEVLIKSINL
jgi:large subunit ribosomal protein L21